MPRHEVAGLLFGKGYWNVCQLSREKGEYRYNRLLSPLSTLSSPVCPDSAQPHPQAATGVSATPAAAPPGFGSTTP